MTSAEEFTQEVSLTPCDQHETPDVAAQTAPVEDEANPVPPVFLIKEVTKEELKTEYSSGPDVAETIVAEQVANEVISAPAGMSRLSFSIISAFLTPLRS